MYCIHCGRQKYHTRLYGYLCHDNNCNGKIGYPLYCYRCGNNLELPHTFGEQCNHCNEKMSNIIKALDEDEEQS